ncbi:MAG: hypothetical protein ACXU86_21330, partial [Archangium sp.]
DDSYHPRFYRGRPHLFWYTEWWYFAFTDPASGWAGITALAAFNPENLGGLGRSGVTTVLFPPGGSTPLQDMTYLGMEAFSASSERADVTVGTSTLCALDADTYRLQTYGQDSGMRLDLLYRRAEAPRLLADEVVGYSPWEVASWLVYMPSARVEGTLTVGGNTVRFSEATGYHDHDWGLWEVARRTWRWAQFSSPAQQLSFVLGVNAAFWYSTARFRLGDLQLDFPGELLRYEPLEWDTWKLFWRYPTRVRVSALDATGEYRLEVQWVQTAVAALWKSPVPLFEQRAQFTGTLLRKEAGAPGGWREVKTFSELGLAEFTDTWL